MNYEEELEKEIENRYKEVRKEYQIYGEANNWTEKNIDRATKQEIDETDYETAILKAKLEGYKKAKEEFNKKVEELKENIKIKFGDNPMKPVKIILKEINKIFKEAK